jgi:hypothetical protein
MPTRSSGFAKQLGADVAEALGADFKYARSRLELRRKVPEGHDVISLSVKGKYSPHLNVAFYFGKHFTAAAKVEEALGGYRFPYHVQQYSPHRQPLYQATYAGADNWDVDLNDANEHLVSDLTTAIRGMAYPFFAQFSRMASARDAIANADASCFSGPMYWRQLLLLDAALGDLGHFKAWSTALDDWSREQAQAELAKVESAMPLACEKF